MTRWQVVLHEDARKPAEKLAVRHAREWAALTAQMERISHAPNPAALPAVRKLRGEPPAYRARAANLRAVFVLHDTQIIVLGVALRRCVYRKDTLDSILSRRTG